jgi:hypothetical protein
MIKIKANFLQHNKLNYVSLQLCLSSKSVNSVFIASDEIPKAYIYIGTQQTPIYFDKIKEVKCCEVL